MRELILLRHAHAEPASNGQADLDRALSAEGLAEAEAAGRWLAENKLVPDCILCSPSRRTRETLELALPRPPRQLVVVVDRSLYLADPDTLLARIAAVRDATARLLVVGHAPGLGELALWLAGDGREGALARMQAKFPTGALAVLRLPGADSWDLARRSGFLDAFLTPRELGAETG